MSEPPAKIARLEQPEQVSNVIVQFQSADGEDTGPQLDLPHNVTPEQLQTLLNGLLKNEDTQPYSFYIEQQELAGELGEHLKAKNLSVEAALKIVYQPQAVFRVRPVGRCTASMPGHSEAVLTVRFSPDGKYLASGSGDTTVRFWDLSTQTPLKEGKNHKGWVLVVAWSPDGQYLVTGDVNGAIWLWDPATGTPHGSCQGHKKYITALAWEPAHKEYPVRRFCSSSKDSTIRVWDAVSRRCLFTLSSHTSLVTSVVWGGEGLIYSGSRDQSIIAWDAKDGKIVRIFKGHGHFVNSLALSSEYAIRTGPFDHAGAGPAEGEEAQAVALRRYQEATGGRPERLVSGSDDFTMFLWQPTVSKQHLARLTGHVQLVNQVQFSPNGQWIASASFDKAIKLWDGLRGTFVATFRGHVGPVYQLAWSSDSRLLVTGSKDSTLKVWNLKSRKLMVDLPGHADEVFSVDWSPDGGSVASGGKDRVLKLWRQ